MQFVIHRFDTLSSTNDEAIRRADEGAPEGTVVVAAEQTSGRGRHGRRWSSPPGDGLYLSVVLRPNIPDERLWQLAFVTAVAAARSIRSVTGLPALIKWPNDVLINGRKVVGILVEARLANPRSVIVGIGVNVNTPSFPDDLADTATSLFLELGSRVEMEVIEGALLSELSAAYRLLLDRGFPALLAEWRSLDCTAGRRVTANTSHGTVSGEALGVTDSGNLLIRREDGQTAELTAGEVCFL